jgi:hypothetical protein
MDNGLHSITDEQYFAEEGLSNSYLWKLISETPAHAQIKTARTDAMALGSAVHLAVLQPEVAAKMIVQGPADRRGKKWTEAQEAADAAGKVILVEKDYATCMTMRDKVWNNQSFASILSGEGAVYEQAAFWEYRGKKCKCKVDVAKPGVIIDLKTSASAGPRDFSQSVAKYGYHQQAASYQYGYGKASGTPVQTFLFLVIEKTPPFAPAIYELDAPTIAEGWASYVTAVEEHINCETNNHFPAYADEKVLLQLPAWAFKHTNPRSVDLAGKYN